MNQALADAVWPGEDALGRTLVVGDAAEPVRVQVVGIAANTRAALAQLPQPIVYLPLGCAGGPHGRHP